MYNVFLSYGQLKEYLALLIQNGLLEYLEGKNSFRTTEKGLKFLKIYEKMEELVAEAKLTAVQKSKKE
jgi:predicted transcriptional regulator